MLFLFRQLAASRSLIQWEKRFGRAALFVLVGQPREKIKPRALRGHTSLRHVLAALCKGERGCAQPSG